LREVIQSPEKLDKMGAAGREKVKRRLTWEAKARQILAVYDAILAKSGNFHSLGYV